MAQQPRVFAALQRAQVQFLAPSVGCLTTVCNSLSVGFYSLSCICRHWHICPETHTHSKNKVFKGYKLAQQLKVLKAANHPSYFLLTSQPPQQSPHRSLFSGRTVHRCSVNQPNARTNLVLFQLGLNVYKGFLGARKQGSLLASTYTPSLPPAVTTYALMLMTWAE